MKDLDFRCVFVYFLVSNTIYVYTDIRIYISISLCVFSQYLHFQKRSTHLI